jgi:hypothetical protein
MQARTDVLDNDVPALPLDWQEARCCAERVLSREKLVSAGIRVAGVAAFLGLVGLVEYALYQMAENWTVSGVGVSVFGYF